MNKTLDEFDNRSFDPNVTSWSENANNFARYSMVVRVFYIAGPPANESICKYFIYF